MALPLIVPVIGGGMVSGLFQGALRNNADRRAANQNLQNAQLQAELFEKRIVQLSAAAVTNSEDVFQRAGEARGERLASLAARGVSLDSQMVESVNFRERENVIGAVNTIVGNAWMEAESFRTEGRLGVAAAQTMLNQVRQRRFGDIMLGGLAGGFQAGSSALNQMAFSQMNAQAREA